MTFQSTIGTPVREHRESGAVGWLLAGAIAFAVAGAGSARAGEAGLDPDGLQVTLAEYVQETLAGDLFEIEAGKLVLQRSTDPAIREFAADAIRDRTESVRWLLDILRSNRVSLAIPASPDRRYRDLLRALAAETDAGFDGAYLQLQIQRRRDALDLQRAYSQVGEIQALQRLAADAAARAAEHLGRLEILTQQRQTARMCEASERRASLHPTS